MKRLTTAAWWYWLLTLIALALATANYPQGFTGAVALCVIQIIHFGLSKRSLTVFPLQVRIAYLGLLLLSLLPGADFILWIQLIGTSAMVTFNYCLLARVLALMPWNRLTPLTTDAIVTTLFSAPVAGSVQQQPARAA